MNILLGTTAFIRNFLVPLVFSKTKYRIIYDFMIKEITLVFVFSKKEILPSKMSIIMLRK
jgi:hypothetical protein